METVDQVELMVRIFWKSSLYKFKNSHASFRLSLLSWIVYFWLLVFPSATRPCKLAPLLWQWGGGRWAVCSSLCPYRLQREKRGLGMGGECERVCRWHFKVCRDRQLLSYNSNAELQLSGAGGWMDQVYKAALTGRRRKWSSMDHSCQKNRHINWHRDGKTIL